MFNEIVVQDEGMAVLNELGIKAKPFKKGYYTLGSVDTVASLVYTSIRAGLKIFNLINIEDIVYKAKRVSGLVINWSTVEMTGLHVDPLTLYSSYVLDATGHPANITQALVKKMGVKLDTPTGSVIGEKSMDAHLGEMHTVENTREVYPGLYVSGMAANAVYGGYRMGPVFGGMFLSGKKAALEIIQKLS